MTLWWDTLTPERQQEFIRRRDALRAECFKRFENRKPLVTPVLTPESAKLLEEGYLWLRSIEYGEDCDP